MTAAERLVKRLRQARDLEAELAKMEAEIRAEVKRKIAKAQAFKAPGKSREARRAAQKARTAAVRVEVFRRDGGRCMVCGDPATEMHHTIYGSGRRMSGETVETCVALCRLHHRMAHEGQTHTLRAILLWAIRQDYRVSAAATQRRMDRIASVTARTA